MGTTREASYRLDSVVPFKFGAIKPKQTKEEENTTRHVDGVGDR